MRAAHLNRKGGTKSNGRGVKRGTPAKEYPPGWFTEPCRAWWAGWVPRLSAKGFDAEAHGRKHGQALRELRVGFGRRNGALPGAAKGPAPGWIE